MEYNNDKVCPLCNSDLRLFSINFKEKILMCGNTNCEYPFCNEDVPIVETDEVSSEDELNSISEVSEDTSTSQERNVTNIDVYLKSPNLHTQVQETKKKKNDIESKLSETNKLFNLLYEESIPHISINNTKWIQNLKQMQETSQERLLSREEMGFVETQEAANLPDAPQMSIKLESDGNLKCTQITPIEIEIEIEIAPSDNNNT